MNKFFSPSSGLLGDWRIVSSGHKCRNLTLIVENFELECLHKCIEGIQYISAKLIMLKTNFKDREESNMSQLKLKWASRDMCKQRLGRTGRTQPGR